MEKELVQMTPEEIKVVRKPINKTKYIATKEEKPKSHWSDKVKCSICDKVYTRSGSANHKKTQYHQVHVKINAKLKRLLLD